MISKLSGGHGFFVRLPSQLVFRNAFQIPECDRCLCFELREQRLRDGYAGLLCVKLVYSEMKPLLNGSRFGAATFRALAGAFQNMVPAFYHARSVLFRDQAESGVAEFDHRDTVFFA